MGKFKYDLRETLLVVPRPVSHTSIQYTPVDKVKMIWRKGPLLLEIIDLELEGTNESFSSCFNRPKLRGSYSDIGWNPADDGEIKFGVSRSANLPAWLNWAQISSNDLCFEQVR